MKIEINDYPSYFEEISKDFKEGRIRESIIRACTLISRGQDETFLDLYFAYRRKIGFLMQETKDSNPLEDEIIICKLAMGRALFNNVSELNEAQKKIESFNKQIRQDLKPYNLSFRTGLFK